MTEKKSGNDLIHKKEILVYNIRKKLNITNNLQIKTMRLLFPCHERIQFTHTGLVATQIGMV